MWVNCPLGFKSVRDFNVTWTLGMKTIKGYEHIIPGIFELNTKTFESYFRYLYT